MLRLGAQSLWNRRFVVALTVLSIALSVFLVLGVERLRTSAKEGFANSASGIDLIVAARGNPVQILMATVFGVGSTGPGIDWDSYEMITGLPQVDWAVPVAMGDNHRGFPVIGTTPNYFTLLRHSGGQPLAFAEGRAFSEADGAVVGAEIAARFGYGVGTVIVNAHGAGAVAFDVHDEAPFTISGILAPTGTAVDRMVLVSLEGFDRLHDAPEPAPADPFDAMPDAEQTGSMQEHGEGRESHDDHAEARPHAESSEEHRDADPEEHDDAHAEDHADDEHDHDAHTGDDHDEHATDDTDAHDHAHEPDRINAIHVGLADRNAILSIQRAVTDYETEPLTAVLPNVALLELWSITGTAENALRLMASAVALAGIVGMVVMLSASLDARRREFAILRSVGATPGRVFGLIVLEAALVTATGIALGLLLLAVATRLVEPIIAAQFGLRLDARGVAGREALLVLAIFAAGLIAGILPALRVYRMTLADGLSFRL